MFSEMFLAKNDYFLQTIVFSKKNMYQKKSYNQISSPVLGDIPSYNFRFVIHWFFLFKRLVLLQAMPFLLLGINILLFTVIFLIFYMTGM